MACPSHTEPFPILPRSSQRHEAFENLLQVRRFGAGEVLREVFRRDGMARRVQRRFHGADAFGQRLRPRLLGSGPLDFLTLDPP